MPGFGFKNFSAFESIYKDAQMKLFQNKWQEVKRDFLAQQYPKVLTKY